MRAYYPNDICHKYNWLHYWQLLFVDSIQHPSMHFVVGVSVLVDVLVVVSTCHTKLYSDVQLEGL